MNSIDRTLLLMLIPWLGSCTIHPLPDDITRETTVSIVEKIKCESRSALDVMSVRYFRQAGTSKAHNWANRLERDQLKTRDILGRFPNDLSLMSRKEKRELILKYGLDQKGLELFSTIKTTSIVFDFTFNITETNDNSINVEFRYPFLNPAGLFTLGLNGGKKLVRKAERKFKITTTAEALAQEGLDDKYCDNMQAQHENLIYPITGKIGMEEVVTTFIELQLGISTPQNAKELTDTLTFTTTLSATATPKISLDPITDQKFRLASAEGTFGETRVDIHKVAVAIGFGTNTSTQGLDKALFASDLRDPDVLVIVPGRHYLED